MSSSDDEPTWSWQRPADPTPTLPMLPAPPPQPYQPYAPPLQYPYPPSPYPYAYPPPPPRKLSALRTCGAVVLALIVVGVLCTTSAALRFAGGSATPAATRGPAAVGATLVVNGLDCNLQSVHTLAGDFILRPKAGNTYIVVRVYLINESSRTVSYNEFDFHVISSGGNVTGPQILPSTYTANLMLDSGQLLPHGDVTGDIVFQVPVHDHGVKLSWQPSIFSSINDNVWSLGL